MFLIYCDEMSNAKVCPQESTKGSTNSSKYILEAIHTYINTYIHTYIHTYILRYDMHHSSMCGTVLRNAVYVLGALVDI
jgi:hypothetical protein